MATATPAKLMTIAEFAALSEECRCELVEGRLTPMPPRPNFGHAIVETRIASALDAFVRQHDLGYVGTGDPGIITSEASNTVRGPDVAYISHAQYARRNVELAFLDVAPELLVEVLSPSNTMREMLRKLEEYFQAGVQLVWIADPDSRCVFAYRSLTDIRRFTAADQLTAEEVLPGFSTPVAELFPPQT